MSSWRPGWADPPDLGLQRKGNVDGRKERKKEDIKEEDKDGDRRRKRGGKRYNERGRKIENSCKAIATKSSL